MPTEKDKCLSTKQKTCHRPAALPMLTLLKGREDGILMTKGKAWRPSVGKADEKPTAVASLEQRWLFLQKCQAFLWATAPEKADSTGARTAETAPLYFKTKTNWWDFCFGWTCSPRRQNTRKDLHPKDKGQRTGMLGECAGGIYSGDSAKQLFC